MSYETYKILHISGVLAIFMAFGGLIVLGSGRKRLLALTHGIGLTVVLIAGFGLMARMGWTTPYTWPGWIYAKMLLWLVAGGLMAFIPRKPALAKPLWFVVIALGMLASWLAISKPF